MDDSFQEIFSTNDINYSFYQFLHQNWFKKSSTSWVQLWCHPTDELEKPMTEVLAFLQSNVPLFEKMTLHQFTKLIFGMLVAYRSITLLGLSHWTEKGGSYHSIQWFYCSSLPWKAIPWLFLPKRFFQSASEYN